MATICRLIQGSEPPINLFYSADDNWAMLEKGLEPNDPERREIWGGYLEDKLVRQDYGKREIPLRLSGGWPTVDALIDAVNALEERLQHAADYQIEGHGDPVFLEWQPHNATYLVRYAVCSGGISKSDLMNACNMPMDNTGHREIKNLVNIGVTLVCEAFWKADTIYALSNLCDNPGFWRGAAPGDSWTAVNAPDLTASIDTTNYEVMGKSLRMVCANDLVNDTGVQSDNYTVVASTAYYFEVRGRHEGPNWFTARVYDVSNVAVIAGTSLIFDNADSAWEKQGVAFTTPVGCVSVRIELLRLAADSSAAGGTCNFDAVYLQPRTDAPTGWSSGRNLVNCLTPTADQINVLCVTEIPGEVPAEAKVSMDLTQLLWTCWNARRTQDDPHNMIWQLLPRDAYTTADAFFGLTHPSCIDSSKVVDANAPGGYKIEVSFAGVQTMQLRAYWNIVNNLPSYYGRWQLILLVSKSANTDDVFMRVQAYNPTISHKQGYECQQEALQATANYWSTLAGWSIFSFPIGVHDDDVWGAGDRWQIRLYASVTGAAAWDNLWIAGVYLIPLDEGAMIAGNPSTQYPAGSELTLDNLDRNKGAFVYSPATDTHYNNIGYIGQLPVLTPKVENWLYFIFGQTFGTGEVLITDPAVVSVQYRPRGKFLRGSNP